MPGKYKEKHGTTRVGDALRWLVRQGKEVAPEILTVAGSITGVDQLKELADKIKGDKKLSEIDKEMLLEELSISNQGTIYIETIPPHTLLHMYGNNAWGDSFDISRSST